MFKNKVKLYYCIPVLIAVFYLANCLKLPQNCGQNLKQSVYKKAGGKIVGGQTTSVSDWPWMANINIEVIVDGQPLPLMSCGGSIINENWILTAAHCVHMSKDPRLYFIYLGYNNLDIKTKNSLRLSASKIIAHQDFDYDKQINDIAIIKLNETLDFKFKHKFLRPVCIPDLINKPTDNCVATGYGSQSKSDDSNRTLMQVLEPIYDLTKCLQIMKSIDMERNICAGGNSAGGLGTCLGDSGGPLQCYSHSEGKWYQMGVTSWGRPCAHPNIPDVFTRVAYYRDWMQNIIENN